MAPEAGEHTIYVLHIPKTACTSLRTVVAHYCPPPGLVPLYPPFGARELDQVRARLAVDGRIVFGHLMFGIDQILGVPGSYVTFLRDPVARVMSYYRHHLGFAPAEHHALLSRGVTLEEFVDRRITHETNNHMTRILAGHGDHAFTDDDALLERALRHLRERFLMVGTAERFAESVDRLREVMGWDAPYPGVLPRENESIAPALELDDATRGVIERDNRLDLALYREAASLMA